ncbi:hypothetical protein G5I_14421 [Acromyrmex echinatior]|uniref:Uncharacterized protein n=1 Tax=Acromyrmex echinatior TaxID=103372 RepID=F4X7N7_ACREC|nr:hypothetical protein G5I_14421 [Acromyrmex echinatior]
MLWTLGGGGCSVGVTPSCRRIKRDRNRPRLEGSGLPCEAFVKDNLIDRILGRSLSSFRGPLFSGGENALGPSGPKDGKKRCESPIGLTCLSSKKNPWKSKISEESERARPVSPILLSGNPAILTGIAKVISTIGELRDRLDRLGDFTLSEEIPPPTLQLS